VVKSSDLLGSLASAGDSRKGGPTSVSTVNTTATADGEADVNPTLIEHLSVQTVDGSNGLLGITEGDVTATAASARVGLYDRLRKERDNQRLRLCGLLFEQMHIVPLRERLAIMETNDVRGKQQTK
jgi:hypothetical protein